MRTKLRSKITLLFMTFGLLLAIPAVALAAELLVAEIDVGTPATPNEITVEQGGPSVALPLRLTASGAIDCLITNTNPAQAKVFKTYSFTKNATSGAVQLSSTDLSDPVDFYSNGTPQGGGTNPNCGVTWETDNVVNATVSAAANVPVGQYTISLKDDAAAVPSGTTFPSDTYVAAPESPGLTDTTATLIKVNVVAPAAPANTAPTVPGVPSGSSPNQGAFTLNWDASTDDGKPAGSSITYTLQHKDANDANFSNVATGISGNSYEFTAASPEAEGTWTYRVSASDGSLSSDFSAASTPGIVVDQSRPNAPLADEGTPDYTATNGDKWFKNSATVTFAANGDPVLADGSDGSGVVSVSDAQSRSTTGALNYSGTATDDVGLVSLPRTGTVHVDATNPVVSLTCPSSSVILNSTANANWTASDVGSGLATADSGSVALDTSAITAAKQASVAAGTATDNVGLQSLAANCSYSVAADFNGFLQPIDGNMVNAGKVGRVYPVKWQLKDDNDVLISDAQGLALAQQMSVQQKGVPCIQGNVDSLETEVAAGSTALRYDETSDQFVFNYKAPSVKGCYDLTIFKADGVNPQTIKFTFTK